jgi:serine phosphatase RsbU (regulator of sigma subunit)
MIPATRDHPAPDVPAGESMTLLVVDDSRVAQIHLCSLLEEAGYAPEAVLVAQSAAEAFDILNVAAPERPGAAVDLVLLDVMMPGMSGVEACRRIKATEHLRDIPIIMVTGQAEQVHLVDAFAAGAMDYIVKPANAVELAARVRSALTLKHEIDRRKAREADVRAQLLRALVAEQALAAANTRLTEQAALLAAELRAAARVQADLLPPEAPHLFGFELAARCVPTRDVGGDFYDWQQPEPGVLCFSLGDVMGKGMAAALLMTTVRAALRAVTRQNPPGATMDAAAAALEPDLDRAGSYVTLFHGRLDLPTRRLRFVDAGHGHVFLHRARRPLDELRPRGLPLGLAFGLPDEPRYHEGSLTFGPGDALVLYSDGVIDARDDLNLDYAGLDHALRGLTSAHAMVERLIALTHVSETPPDDITILVLRCSDAAPPPADPAQDLEDAAAAPASSGSA